VLAGLLSAFGMQREALGLVLIIAGVGLLPAAG